MYDVEALRRNEFPNSHNHIYFNHAAISPLPQRALKALRTASDALALNPTRYFVDIGKPEIETMQATIANFVNAANPQEIVPVTSTSAALNQIAQSLIFEDGDNILFCADEFPSNAYPWMSLERDGVDVRRVPGVDGGLTLAQLEPLVDERSRMIAASAVQFFSGHRTDLEAIGRFCNERGIIFVVDAIQAIGHVPLDVQALHIDVLATGGQKSLMAVPGIGFMYVREAIAEAMQPRSIGPNATVDFLHWLNYDMTPAESAQRFWSGTPNLVGMMAMHQSVGLLVELGVENIDNHTRGLAAQARAGLLARGFRVVTPDEEHGPIVTFATGMSEEDTDAWVGRFTANGVTLGKHLDASGTAYIRISVHCYNTAKEIGRFLEIVDTTR